VSVHRSSLDAFNNDDFTTGMPTVIDVLSTTSVSSVQQAHHSTDINFLF